MRSSPNGIKLFAHVEDGRISSFRRYVLLCILLSFCTFVLVDFSPNILPLLTMNYRDKTSLNYAR